MECRCAMPVMSGERIMASAKSTNDSTTVDGTTGTNEIDNHADTVCAGPNWKLLELTGELCNVTPFSSDYEPKSNIPVAKCATTYTCPDSEHSVFLIADQVLWFGTALHCSLINPHQIRAFGHRILCDDPWDPNRTLGLDVRTMFTPLLTSGPNLYFETHETSPWELDNFPVIKLTAPHWNPSTLVMPTNHRALDERNIDAISSLCESATVLSHITPSLDPRRLFSPLMCRLRLRGQR